MGKKRLLPRRPGRPYTSFLLLAVFFLTASSVIFFSLPAPAVPVVDDGPVVYSITVFAGQSRKGFKDGSNKKALFNWPTGVAPGKGGVILVADYGNNALREIRKGSVLTLNSIASSGAGKGGYKDGPVKDALFRGPNNMAIDKEGNIFIADADNFRIRKITPDGTVSTIAGGTPGYRNGPALKARFGYPTGVAVGDDGTIFVADRRTHTIRKISTEGIVSTIAGNPNPGYADGRGVMSHFKEPVGVAVYGKVVYVTDSGNNAVRKIMPDGRVLTLAGAPEHGFRDGSRAGARFSWPTGIAVDKQGNIFVCDSGNNSIRRITQGGSVSTITIRAGRQPHAGRQPRAGRQPHAGRQSPAAKSKGTGVLRFPTGIALSPSGDIYVADSGNNNIKKISRDR